MKARKVEKVYDFDVHQMPQRSPEWYAIRAGRVTGSVADAVFKTTLKSGGEPAARRDLRMKMATERLTGVSQERDFINEEMQWGLDQEANAIERYEAISGNLVKKAGFLAHKTLLVGTSPDAYVGAFDYMVSIKCPKSATHLSYLQRGGIPEDYIPQMLHEMWLTGAQEYHFMSYDPRFPWALQANLVVIPRTQDLIDNYAEKVKAFLDEVDRDLQLIRGMYPEEKP
jgi:hypothetical protein